MGQRYDLNDFHAERARDLEDRRQLPRFALWRLWSLLSLRGSRLANAVKAGRAKRVRRFLQTTRDIREVVARARVYQRCDIVTLALENGANANWVVDDSPLLVGVCEHRTKDCRGGSKAHERAVERLLELGANPNAVDISLRTALYRASQLGDATVVSMLIRSGADVNTGSEDGTPLKVAWTPEVAELLREAGGVSREGWRQPDPPALTVAEPHQEKGGQIGTWKQMFRTSSPSGESTLTRTDGPPAGSAGEPTDDEVDSIIADMRAQRDLSASVRAKLSREHVRAMLRANREVADELIRQYGDVNAALTYAAQEGPLITVIELVRRGGNPDTWVRDVTALFTAVSRGHLDIVDYLLSAGANPNQRSTKGTTPLLLAAQKGYAEIVTQLIAKGADVHAVSAEGNNALEWALKEKHQEVLGVLVRAGAKLNAKRAEIWLVRVVLDDEVLYCGESGMVQNPAYSVGVLSRDAAKQVATDLPEKLAQTGVRVTSCSPLRLSEAWADFERRFK